MMWRKGKEHIPSPDRDGKGGINESNYISFADR